MKKNLLIACLGVLASSAVSCSLPLCENGSIVCTYKVKRNADCINRCKPDAKAECPAECLCDDNEEKCVNYSTMKNTDVACTQYVCENEEFIIKTGNPFCSNGFDGDKAKCNLVCELGKVKYEEDDDSSKIIRCVEDSSEQNKWETEICAYGIDRSTEKCKTECVVGEVQYKEPKGLDPIIRRCVEAEDGTPRWNEEKCKYGINKIDQKCKPTCTVGQIEYDEDANIIKRCTQNADGDIIWDPETCQFGVNKKKAICKDPCHIAQCDDDNTSNCTKELYDEITHYKYKCSSSQGWDIDSSCSMDFHVDDSMPQDLTISHEAMSQKLQSLFDGDLENLKMGKCGECSVESSPTFCSVDDSTIYKHLCDNGQFRNEPNGDCSSYADTCYDEFGLILVDLQSNRNHCGTCDNMCDTNQICDNGKCLSKFECVDHYARIQLESRWVNAYCIENLEDLKNIPNLDPEHGNLDFAFILKTDIDIDEEWSPIEVPSFILLGNNKTIRFKENARFKTIQDTGVAGLFSELSNTYIDDLTLRYESTQITNAQVFGLLAGTALTSNIHNVTIDASEKIITDGSETVGGMFGIAMDGTSIFDTILNVKIEARNQNTEKDNSGIGGLIGYAQNIKRVENVSTIDTDSIISVEGSVQVGGLIGLMSDKMTSINNVTQILDNSNILENHLSIEVIGHEKVGGIIGYIKDKNSEDNVPAASIQNFVIDDVKLTLKQTEENTSFDGEQTPESRYFGGLVGLANGHRRAPLNIENIAIAQVTMSEDRSAVEHPFLSANAGGIAGTLTYASLKSINIRDIVFEEGTSWSQYIGGLAGVAVDVYLAQFYLTAMKFTATPLATLNLEAGIENFNNQIMGFASDVGGFLGYAAQSTITNGFSICMGFGTCKGIQISGATDRVGGMVGSLYETDVNSMIINHVKILNSNGENIGGLVGISRDSHFQHITENTVEITGVQADIRSNVNTGGLIGKSVNTELKTITFGNATITSDQCDYVGGLIGHLDDGTIASILVDSLKLNARCSVGGLIGFAEGAFIISDTSVLSHIHDSKSFGGLIKKLSDSNFVILNTVVETYADFFSNETNDSGAGFIDEPNDNCSGIISHSMAFTLAHSGSGLFSSFIRNSIKATEIGNYGLMYTFQMDSTENFRRRSKRLHENNNKYVCCENLECCSNNGDDGKCQETDIICSVSNRYLLTAHANCSEDEFYDAFASAFCDNDPDTPQPDISLCNENKSAIIETIGKDLKSDLLIPLLHQDGSVMTCSDSAPKCNYGVPLCERNNSLTCRDQIVCSANGERVLPHCYDNTLHPSFCH